MPVAAVAIAGLAVGGAVELTTAAIGAIVGATVAAVASVTGSKPLQIAGSVLGVVGDVRALACSARTRQWPAPACSAGRSVALKRRQLEARVRRGSAAPPFRSDHAAQGAVQIRGRDAAGDWGTQAYSRHPSF
jgi:hypothetical protein